MNKIFLTLACIFPLMVLNSCTKGCRAKTQDDTVLKIGTNANFPPFESVDQNGKLIGFDIDIGHELGKKLGRTVEFKEFDFDALILALEKGQIDIILSGMSITESRKKEIAMVAYQGEPLTEISFLFWEAIPDGISSMADLKQKALEKNQTVSLQSGHFFEEILKGEGVPLKLLPGSPEQVLDIKYGKSLAAAIDFSVGKKLSAEHSDLKLKTLPLPQDKWDLGNGIGIKKTRTDLIDKITQAVEGLKADGTLDTLKNKWFKGGQ